MINRFNKPASTKVRDFTQETDAQLAYRLQNEEFRNLYQEKKTTRNPPPTQPPNPQINDDLTEIVIDGASEIRNRELSDHEYALNLQNQYSKEAQLINQRNNFASVQDELNFNLQIEKNPQSNPKQPSNYQKSNKSSESRSSVDSDEKLAKKLQNKEIRRAQRDLKKLAEQEDLAALENRKISKSTPPTEDELTALKLHRQQLLAENARIASDKNQIIQRIHEDRRNENKNRKHREATGRVSPSAVSMDPRALDYDIQEIDRREREIARQRMELEKEVNRAHEVHQKNQIEKTNRQTTTATRNDNNNTSKTNDKCKIQ